MLFITQNDYNDSFGNLGNCWCTSNNLGAQSSSQIRLNLGQVSPKFRPSIIGQVTRLLPSDTPLLRYTAKSPINTETSATQTLPPIELQIPMHAVAWISDPPKMTGSGRSTVRSRARSDADADADADSRRQKRPPFNRQRERSRYGSSIPIYNNANLKVLLGICFVAFFIIWFMIHHLSNSVTEPKLPRAVTPFPAPKIMDLPQVNFQLSPFFFQFWEFDHISVREGRRKKEEWLGWCCCSLKVSTRRVCIGELIVLTCISEFAPGIMFPFLKHSSCVFILE